MIGKFLPSDQTDLFRMRLDQMVNMRHELIILSKELDWTWIESELSGYYAAEGRPAIPVRTMVGMLLLKQMFNQSDETVIYRWVENPYWQYFTGEEFFQHKAPFDPSDFVHFRKRVGESGMEKVVKAPLSTPFNGRAPIKDRLSPNKLADASLSLSHVAMAMLLRDALPHPLL